MPRCKLSLRILMFLVILEGAALVLFVGWYYVHLNPCGTKPSNEKVHVLLLSSWRSGSSFLGQVFNNHPSVFYLMEPGWHVWTKLQKPTEHVLRMALRDLLRSIFLCDFSVMSAYLPVVRSVASLFMWRESRALCSLPVCSLPLKNHSVGNQTVCSKTCGFQDLQVLDGACGSYSHVVLKEVRFFELESLYPLLQDPNLNLFIIHLVRDPRAVVRSRMDTAYALGSDASIVLDQKTIPPPEVQYQVMNKICESHVHIHKMAIFHPPPFLKGRYKMVRYEDLVRNPIDEINALFEFVGLEMTTLLEEWIHRSTRGQGKGSKNEAFKTTSRNAAEVAEAWRTTLPHRKVRQVQQACWKAMLLLGYRPVNSENEQKTLDLDLLSNISRTIQEPQEQYQFIWLPKKAENSTDTYKNND